MLCSNPVSLNQEMLQMWFLSAKCTKMHLQLGLWSGADWRSLSAGLMDGWAMMRSRLAELTAWTNGRLGYDEEPTGGAYSAGLMDGWAMMRSPLAELTAWTNGRLQTGSVTWSRTPVVKVWPHACTTAMIDAAFSAVKCLRTCIVHHMWMNTLWHFSYSLQNSFPCCCYPCHHLAFWKIYWQ